MKTKKIASKFLNYNSLMQIFADKKFEDPIRIIEAFDNESFIEAFNEIEALRKNNYLLGYIRYEAKDIFLGKNIKSKLPLLYFEVYGNKPKPFLPREETNNYQITKSSNINYKTYSQAIKKIQKEIANGNTYEVNYTYDYTVETDLDGFELYNTILPRQTTPYNAYIKNKYEEILSFSPELFFELENNRIKTKPMKGTIKRGQNEKEDKQNIEFLRNDIKNRAENVMIVDLLRNDLGKIAKTGSVKVDKLFDIETHKTLHQMTSEISAELEDNTSLYEIFKAIYPCGSITGAPKNSTMEIIERVETGKRGVYCGAIGLISPEKTVFSVPIRILVGNEAVSIGRRTKSFTCRVGGAIVWDSTAKEEWEETLTKIGFLSADFKIVETILVKNGKMKYKADHFNRMKKSAKELGYKFNPEILKICPKQDGILRILLNNNGNFETQELPLNNIETRKVTLSKIIINSKEPLLKHKTTFRPFYKESMKKIKQGLIFDEIFFNEKGELTEGARSNIVLQIDGKLLTPHIMCGLLNGVMRQKLLKEKKIKEKKLYIEDLNNAEKVFCINSVRGIVEVKLDENCERFKEIKIG